MRHFQVYNRDFFFSKKWWLLIKWHLEIMRCVDTLLMLTLLVMMVQQMDVKEIKQVTFLSHGRQPEVHELFPT